MAPIEFPKKAPSGNVSSGTPECQKGVPDTPGQDGALLGWHLCRSGAKKRGVLARGISAESSVTPKETKNTQGHWAQQCIWALRAPHPREVYIFAKTSF